MTLQNNPHTLTCIFWVSVRDSSSYLIQSTSNFKLGVKRLVQTHALVSSPFQIEMENTYKVKSVTFLFHRQVITLCSCKTKLRNFDITDTNSPTKSWGQRALVLSYSKSLTWLSRFPFSIVILLEKPLKWCLLSQSGTKQIGFWLLSFVGKLVMLQVTAGSDLHLVGTFEFFTIGKSDRKSDRRSARQKYSGKINFLKSCLQWDLISQQQPLLWSLTP